jgi:hypothetical protein
VKREHEQQYKDKHEQKICVFTTKVQLYHLMPKLSNLFFSSRPLIPRATTGTVKNWNALEKSHWHGGEISSASNYVL